MYRIIVFVVLGVGAGIAGLVYKLRKQNEEVVLELEKIEKKAKKREAKEATIRG